MAYRRIVLLILTVFAIGMSAVSAQDADSDIPPELLEQMEELENITSVLRALDRLNEVEHAFPTRMDTIAYLEELYSRELPQTEVDRTTAFYVALGLLPADIDLRQVYLDLLGSQVAGFYDTDTQVMNVIPTVGDVPGTSLSLMEQIIYVHEYTHALQDMHFDLDTVLPSDTSLTQPDQALARTALVEGDATAVMQVYLQEIASNNPMAALGLLAEGTMAGALLPPEGIPDILMTELTFPYEAGLTFVTEVWADGGWEAVDATYSNPPTTTEQVMHAEKYLAGEGAAEVSLGDLTPGDEWETVWDTTLGEFYLREHIRAFAEFDTAAGRAAAGWGGDSFRIWQNGDELAWALKIVWDTPEDAAEFAEVYSEATSAFNADCAAYVTGMLCAVETEDGATVITHAPDLELAQALLAGA